MRSCSMHRPVDTVNDPWGVQQRLEFAVQSFQPLGHLTLIRTAAHIGGFQELAGSQYNIALAGGCVVVQCRDMTAHSGGRADSEILDDEKSAVNAYVPVVAFIRGAQYLRDFLRHWKIHRICGFSTDDSHWYSCNMRLPFSCNMSPPFSCRIASPGCAPA